MPAYLSNPAPPERSENVSAESRWECENARHEASIEDYFQQEKVSSLQDITTKFKTSYTLPEEIVQTEISSQIVFYAVTLDNSKLETKFNLTIFENLQFEIWCDSKKLSSNKVAHITTDKIDTLSQLYNLIIFAKNYNTSIDYDLRLENCITELEELVQHLPEELQQKLIFLAEQIRLSSVKIKKQRRYSARLLSLAVLWENCSPALYNQILSDDILCLPSRKRIHDLTHAFTVETGLSSGTRAYLKARAEKLNDREKLIIIQEDEIYCAKRVEYAQGKISGIDSMGASDLKLEPTKTLLCIMVRSVAGNYFDIVALYPVVNLDSKILKTVFDKVMDEVVPLSFKVVGNGLDAYSANRKFYTHELCHGDLQTSVHHPSQPDIPVHLIFDAVHVFKNIYCNFLNRKYFKCPAFEEGEEEIVADISHLHELYKLELGKPAKKAYRLTDKVLNPQPIERTKVSLADAFFHETTIASLEWFAEFEKKPEWAKTARFLKLIRKWWNIVNVRTMYNGQMKRDNTKEPITSVDAWQLQFLDRFANWLQDWQKTKAFGLTSETFLASKQTSKALKNLATFLLENGVQYVLLGLAQSDSIENRFGWYRNLNGSNYYVSVRQILSAEKAIRVKSLLQLSSYSLSEAKEVFLKSEEEKSKENQQLAETLLTFIESTSMTEMKLTNEDASTAFYLAGYSVHGILKRVKCQSCSDILMSSSNTPNEKDLKEQNLMDCQDDSNISNTGYFIVFFLFITQYFFCLVNLHN